MKISEGIKFNSKHWESLLSLFDFPDEQAGESALVGELDSESDCLIKDYMKALTDYITFRENNHFDVSNKEWFIKFYLENKLS